MTRLRDKLRLLKAWKHVKGELSKLKGSPMGEKFAKLFQSRRFLAALVNLIVITGNERFGLNLNYDQLFLLTVTIAGWIVGDSINKT